METKASNEAAIPNPTLEPLRELIGNWATKGTHPLVPGKTFHGRTSFNWIEGGAFLIMHSEIDEEEIPSGIAIFGSDNVTGEIFMLYFDERKVSRKYNVKILEGGLEWWRLAPGFSQRMSLAIANAGQTLVSKGMYSRDGVTWENDLELTYSRLPLSEFE